LEPVKGLVEFMEKVPACILEGWLLVIIGEGSLKARVEAVIQNRGLSPWVKILNYVPYEEMPVLYAASDLFILPSVYDPNPLSVIEAMHSGLPLLLSEQVGNFPEALREGVTGWGFSPFDDNALGRASQQAFSAPLERLQALGLAAKNQAEKVWNSESAIRSFVDALGLQASQTGHDQRDDGDR
jgi:glycosyltransferase involved in cell wall biosynthesis